MKSIIGLGRLCPFSKSCKEDNPCKRCLYIGRTEGDKAIFTPAQEQEIQNFLDKNKDLMDDLAELEKKEKLTNDSN